MMMMPMLFRASPAGGCLSVMVLAAADAPGKGRGRFDAALRYYVELEEISP